MARHHEYNKMATTQKHLTPLLVQISSLHISNKIRVDDSLSVVHCWSRCHREPDGDCGGKG